MRLVLGPEKSAIDVLRQLHDRGEVSRITVLVAWAGLLVSHIFSTC